MAESILSAGRIGGLSRPRFPAARPMGRQNGVPFVASDGSLQDIVCCLGQPVAGNPTQFILERGFVAAGLEWRCLTAEVPPVDLGDAIRGLRAMGFRGAMLSLPHRVAVVEHLDGLTEAAEHVAAANFIFREDHRLIGDNTDGAAFLEALRTVIDPAEKQVVLLGAGGAARAIAFELARAGAASIHLVSRTPEHGQFLAELVQTQLDIPANFVPWDGDYVVEDGAQIVINATSVGLGDTEARLDLNVDSLHEGTVVADLIVNPPQTRLLRDAAQRGCTSLHGLDVLVSQAVRAFQRWTGVDPDAEVMREAVEEYLEF
jgi:shikimate dehydrogenase